MNIVNTHQLSTAYLFGIYSFRLTWEQIKNCLCISIYKKPQLFALQKKPDWALGEKEGKSKSTSEAPAEAAEVSPKTESFYT